MVVETPFALLERISDDVVVQRWKPGITLDLPTIKATMAARHDLFGSEAHAVVVIVPEGVRFAMNFLENDQYDGTDAATMITAMANVVEAQDIRAIVSLYYAHHPPAYPFGVFAHLEEAMAWVREHFARQLAS